MREIKVKSVTKNISMVCKPRKGFEQGDIVRLAYPDGSCKLVATAQQPELMECTGCVFENISQCPSYSHNNSLWCLAGPGQIFVSIDDIIEKI